MTLAERCTIETAELILGLKRRNIQAMAARGAIPGAERNAYDDRWLFDVAKLRAFVKQEEGRAEQQAKRRLSPTDPRISLYRHYDENGTLLYVGITSDPVRRLTAHETCSHWYNHIARIEIERHPTREAAVAAELAAIRNEKPLHNIAGRAAS